MVPYLPFTLGEPIGGWIADRLVAMGSEEVFSRRLVISISYVTSLLLIPAALVGLRRPSVRRSRAADHRRHHRA